VPMSGSEIECLCPSSGCLFPHRPGCGYEANADGNAAASLAERFSDQELNWLSFRDVETILVIRCMCRLPDARSASAGPELPIL
jgi:transposase